MISQPTVISVLLVILPLWIFLGWRRRSLTLSMLPGPPVPSLLLGHALELRKAPVGTYVSSWIKQYGQTFRFQSAFAEPWLALADPKGATHVLNSKKYIRNPSDTEALKIWFGHSLVSAEGDDHRQRRKTLNVAFTTQAVRDIAPTILDLADRLARQYADKIKGQPNATFDVASLVHMFSLDAISMTMFAHACSEENSKIPDLLRKLTNSPPVSASTIIVGTIITTFPALLKTSIIPAGKWANMLRTELGAIAEQVWKGKSNVDMHAKLLYSLSQGYEDGSVVSKDDAIAEIIGILFAGSETIANVITECLYALAKDRRIQDKLRQELNAHPDPSYDALMSSSTFPYLDAVMKEAWRTKAVLVNVRRMANEDDVIPLEYPIQGTGAKQVPVKKGQRISIFVRDGLNSDETIWGPRASDFWPERWIEEGGLPDSVQTIQAPGHTMAFGDGPKICIGRLLASAEFKIVISKLIRQFSFSEAKDVVLDFYHLGGNTVKPVIRGRENEGVKLPLEVTPIVL